MYLGPHAVPALLEPLNSRPRRQKMHPLSPSHRHLLLAIAALTGVALGDNPDKTTKSTSAVVTPCVATATSGAFFDLRPDTAVFVAEGEKPPKGARTEDYVARGWDYGSNFTLNICDAVVEKVKDVVGVDKSLWKNVSAYYEADGKVYSIGYGILAQTSHLDRRMMLTFSAVSSQASLCPGDAS